MAFQSLAVPVLDTDTDVIVCPATYEGAAVLAISNISGGASTYTLKVYRQASGLTQVLADTVAISAKTTIKFPAPISLQAGDKIVMVAPAAATIVAGGTFTISAATPAAAGFTPQGDWSSIATYATNDVVSYSDGNSYVSRVDSNLNNQPDTSTAQWMVLAERGAPGADGSGDMTAANNLSELTDKPAAFSEIKQAATDSATGVVEKATAAEIAAATADKYPDAAGVLSAMAFATITPGASPSVDHAAGVNQKITHSANATMGAPSNSKVGWPLNIWIVPGAYTTAWNAVYKFGDDGAPTIDAEGIACFVCLDSSNYVFLGFREKA